MLVVFSAERAGASSSLRMDATRRSLAATLSGLTRLRSIALASISRLRLPGFLERSRREAPALHLALRLRMRRMVRCRSPCSSAFRGSREHPVCRSQLAAQRARTPAWATRCRAQGLFVLNIVLLVRSISEPAFVEQNLLCWVLMIAYMSDLRRASPVTYVHARCKQARCQHEHAAANIAYQLQRARRCNGTM